MTGRPHVLTITLNPAVDLALGVERLMPGTVHRAQRSETIAGGKGHNVARVLASLGHAVTVSGFLGADNAGLFETAFDNAGLIDGCTRLPGATRVNVKIGEADGRVSDINQAGLAVDGAAWQDFMDTLAGQLAERPAAVVLAGSPAPGVDETRLAALIAEITAREIPLWLDTSAAALTAGVAAGPAMIKPNEDELAVWLGRAVTDRADLIAAARAMQAKGAAEVAVSRGPDGVLWLTRDTLFLAEAPTVPVVDTVGAGDTLLAGLLHGRLTGWPDLDTLAFATALAAEAVTHVGVGRATSETFARLRAQTPVTTLSDPAADAAARGTSA